MSAIRSSADGWTVDEARAEFAKTGIPMDHLDRIIRALPGFRRIGEKPSGQSGGRGAAVYDIGQLQLLHGALARWLTVQGPPSKEDAGYALLAPSHAAEDAERRSIARRRHRPPPGEA